MGNLTEENARIAKAIEEFVKTRKELPLVLHLGGNPPILRGENILLDTKCITRCAGESCRYYVSYSNLDNYEVEDLLEAFEESGYSLS